MTPRNILRRLELAIGIAGSPRRLKDAIENELRNHFGLVPIQAAEQAEELEEPTRKLILQVGTDREGRGSPAILAISTSSEKIVLGSCYAESTDSPPVLAAKLRYLQVEPLLRQIRSLSFDEFEVFGARVLSELGASTVRITPHSDDQGIDFYGILSVGQLFRTPLPFGRLAHDVTLRFAGQAKHYPTRAIGPSVIRELVGSIALARYKVFTRDPDLFDELELQAFNPLLAMLFTTGTFTRGAVELAQKAGILARTGEQLAVFLAHQSVGIETHDGFMVFSDEKFHRWLEAA